MRKLLFSLTAMRLALALAQARQQVEVTTGDLKIVVLVCDDLTDVEIHQQINFLKTAALGLDGTEFQKSRYWEDASGQGYTDGDEEDDFDVDETLVNLVSLC
jgi:hypothetical protein